MIRHSQTTEPARPNIALDLESTIPFFLQNGKIVGKIRGCY